MDARIEKVLRDLQEEDTRDRVDGTSQALRLRAVTPEAGRFLHLMVKLTSAERILEAGTSGGCSTIWLASAARETGADRDLCVFELRESSGDTTTGTPNY